MVQVDHTNSSPYRPNVYATEASSLGLEPGSWPRRMRTTLGNEHDFALERAQRDIDGTIELVVYKQELGVLSLIVYND